MNPNSKLIAGTRRPGILLSLAFLFMSPFATGADVTETVGQGIGPNLATGPSGEIVLSYIETLEGRSRLVHARIDEDGIGAKRVVASGDNWFVNWADFPSVVPINKDLWAAHWLVRQPVGGYAYDIETAISRDGGNTWSPSILVNDDGTATEHGFVSLYPHNEGYAALWLDGRQMSSGHSEDGHGSGGMTLRSGHFGADGKAGLQTVIDDLTCDCCQTDVAVATDGPVAAYRNRSTDEIRDIYVARFDDGRWQAGVPVAEDGWLIAGCPVNGPVIQANGNTVAVAWFTAANDQPAVNVAWSTDGGRNFSAKIEIASGEVNGYVGATMQDANSLVASWMCSPDGKASAVCYRRVNRDGSSGAMQTIATNGLLARMSVPQIASLGDTLVFAWSERIDGENRILMATRAWP